MDQPQEGDQVLGGQEVRGRVLPALEGMCVWHPGKETTGPLGNRRRRESNREHVPSRGQQAELRRSDSCGGWFRVAGSPRRSARATIGSVQGLRREGRPVAGSVPGGLQARKTVMASLEVLSLHVSQPGWAVRTCSGHPRRWGRVASGPRSSRLQQANTTPAPTHRAAP